MKRSPQNMCNKKEQSLTVPTFNLVLTPVTYTTIVGEILKWLIYEKSQIPYPYNYLENIITRKRNTTENQGHKMSSVVTKQLKLATSAFDCIKELVNCLKTVFSCNNNNNIKEIIVLFGSNTFSAKETYTFVVPRFASGHLERNHYLLTSKYQHNVLRYVFMSKEWTSKMEIPLVPTNFHFVLRLTDAKSVALDDSTFELFSTNTCVSMRNGTNLIVNFSYDANIIHNCCSTLSVYEDRRSSESDEETSGTKESSLSECSVEIQNKMCELKNKRIRKVESEYIVFKNVWSGFKEKFVNQVPSLELC